MVIAGLLGTPMTSEMPSMKECMEQRDVLLNQNEALEVTCVPKQSHATHSRIITSCSVVR